MRESVVQPIASWLRWHCVWSRPRWDGDGLEFNEQHIREMRFNMRNNIEGLADRQSQEQIAKKHASAAERRRKASPTQVE